MEKYKKNGILCTIEPIVSVHFVLIKYVCCQRNNIQSFWFNFENVSYLYRTGILQVENYHEGGLFFLPTFNAMFKKCFKLVLRLNFRYHNTFHPFAFKCKGYCDKHEGCAGGQMGNFCPHQSSSSNPCKSFKIIPIFGSGIVVVHGKVLLT